MTPVSTTCRSRRMRRCGIVGRLLQGCWRTLKRGSQISTLRRSLCSWRSKMVLKRDRGTRTLYGQRGSSLDPWGRPISEINFSFGHLAVRLLVCSRVSRGTAKANQLFLVLSSTFDSTSALKPNSQTREFEEWANEGECSVAVFLTTQTGGSLIAFPFRFSRRNIDATTPEVVGVLGRLVACLRYASANELDGRHELYFYHAPDTPIFRF